MMNINVIGGHPHTSASYIVTSLQLIITTGQTHELSGWEQH